MKNKSIISRLFATSVFLFSVLAVSAQGAAKGGSSRGILEFLYQNIILLLGVAAILAAFGTIIYLFNMLLRLQENRMLQEQGIEAVKTTAAPTTSWLAAFYDKLTGTVPLEKEKDILFDHSYDGIRELDNSLPPWWLALFYITIVFAVVYIGYYHFSDYGKDQYEIYEQDIANAEQAKLAFLAKQANQIDETTAEVVTDEDFIAVGKDIFMKNCVACHGNNGEGNTIGPNLTDEYWIHGGSIKDVFKTVKYGVVQKGMQSWKEVLPPTAIHQVSNYILTLQGTNPPNAKAPEGDLYK